ncbi:hypothetical protein B5M09_009498, partial [Aphanomyces astaci]
VYKIQVECNGLTWTVDRRYKQFYALHDDVLREAESPFKMYLPPLPPRRALTPKKGAFVAKRQQRLEAYLQDMVALPQLAQDVRVMVFLGSMVSSVLHVSAVHTALEYGDVLLFKTRFGTSKVQRKVQNYLSTSRGVLYDHAAIVVPGSVPGLLSMLESTGEGIQVYPLVSILSLITPLYIWCLEGVVKQLGEVLSACWSCSLGLLLLLVVLLLLMYLFVVFWE